MLKKYYIILDKAETDKGERLFQKFLQASFPCHPEAVSAKDLFF
jgi:hypothetical protein